MQARAPGTMYGRRGVNPEGHDWISAGVPKLVDLPGPRMWIDYDAKVDVFYISFPRPQRASDSEARDDGIIIHRCGKQVVALAITEARKG